MAILLTAAAIKSKRKKRKKKPVNWAGRAAKIRKFKSLHFKSRVNFTPEQKKQLGYEWSNYRYVSTRNLRHVEPAARRILKNAGYRVEKKGAIIERMSGPGNEPIKGARLYVRRDGVVTQTVKQRKDYLIPLTGKAREVFALDPTGYAGKKVDKLGIKKKRRQWVHLVVDGHSWGKMSPLEAGRKLQSFRDKNISKYKKSSVNLKIITFTGEKSSDGKTTQKGRKRK